jgi:hypothetical protein
MYAPRYWIHPETQQHLRYAPHHEAPDEEWAFAQADAHGWLSVPRDIGLPMPVSALCDVKSETGEIMLNKSVDLVPWSKMALYRPVDMPPPGLEGPCLYVAGPYRAPSPAGVTKNVRKAQQVAAVAAARGWFPVVPHNLSHGFEAAGDDAYWLAHTLAVMERCDALVLVPGWERSEGTIAEVARARQMTIPVYDGLHELPGYQSREPDGLRLSA